MSDSKDLATREETVSLKVLVPATKLRPGGLQSIEVPASLAAKYPAIGGVEEMAEVAAEVFGDGEANLGIGDLTRVKVPSGESKAFTIGDDVAKTFEGIAILRQERRNYWAKSPEDGGNQAPDCYSRDAVHGVGLMGIGSQENPTGLCADCPFAQWSELEGKRVPPPCKQQEAVLVLTEGRPFPILLTVPRTSIKSFREYWKKTLFMGGLKTLQEVVTKFGLKLVKNDAGIDYNELTFEMVEDLGKGAKLVNMSIGEQYRTVLVNVDTSGADDESVSTAPNGGGAVSFEDEGYEG